MAKFKSHHAIKMKGSTIRKEVLDINVHSEMRSLCSNLMNYNIYKHSTSSSVQAVEEPMGTTFSHVPFAYPTSKEKHRIINQLLQFSLRQQRDEDISGCSGFVSYVICMCLKAMKIECKMDRGYLDKGSETSPHMWLIIEDFIIDNCYVKTLTKDRIAYIKKKYPKCYKCEMYVYSSSDLGSNDKDKIFLLRKKKMIDLFKVNAQKAMTLCLNREDLSNYFFAMVRFMWEEFKVNIAGIDPSIRFICWQCGKEPSLSGIFINDIISDDVGCETLLSDQAISKQSFKASFTDESWKLNVCSRCKIASYCTLTCQSLDWKENHKFTCQTRSSVMLLPSDGPD